MSDIPVSSDIDFFMQSVDQTEMRTRLALGDAATKNTGTTAGTVAAGNDSRITGALQTSGGTMTGKLTAAADNTIAKLSVGSRTVGSSPTTLSDGDIWISNQGALSYRDSTGPTSRAVAATSLSNTFNQPQTIGVGAGTALTVNNSGTGTAASIANTATATSDAVVITNLGSGNSLVVNDETTPDSTRFAVANNGRVGIGVTPDASVALSVDTTGIKFGDGTIQTTAGLTGTVQEANGGTGETTYTNGQLLIGNAAGGLTKATLTAGTNVTITNGDGAITINATGGGGGGGTVTSVTAGTGLTGGTITSTGTIAADFGATTGKVTEGGTTVLKAGDTMTGKLTLPAATTTSAPLNVGSSGVQPTSPAVGDVWIRNNLLQYRGSSITVNSVAATAEPNTFSARQAINATDTLPALRVTQLGTGEALRVEDEANPDATAFVVANNGRVGVGVTPDAAVALSVDTSGIKFGDNTTQTTAFTGTASNVTGTVAIANGGTGQTDRQAAMDALAGATTSGQYLRGNGTDVVMSAIQAADVPTLNQNTTGTAANVTGTVAIANGGTGQTTPNAAVNALLPSQSGNSGKVLSTDGTNTSWITSGGVGTVTSVDVSGGTTGLTTSGGPVTGSGTITITGTLALANGGTGATTQPGAANAVLPSQASNSGKFLTTDGSNVSWATTGGGGGSTTQVARYLTTQNVTVPAGAKKLDVFCVGGGGGGGGASGSNGALANRGGGAGGGAGGFSTASFDATALPASIQVVVGAAGTAGTGGTGLNDGTAGGSAGRSGVTTIGADITTFPCFISAFQGNGGGAGLTNGSGGSAGSAATSALFSGTNGGAGGSGGGAGSAGSAQNASAGARGPTGGGGGGAISTTTFANGAAGGNLVLQASGGGGTAGTTNGANGGNGWTALYDGQTAAGGGGGAGSSTGTGGTGGAGGFPGGGGGGGGAGLNNGGNGGAGGAGIVVLTWYF